MLELRPTTRIVDLAEYASPWTLIHGEALDVLRGLPDGLADGMIADPPYSSGGMMRSDRNAPAAEKYSPTQTYPAFSGDNRDARSWAFWCVLWLTECMRIVKPGGYLLMFTDWRQLPMATDVFQASGAVWRGIITWNKGPTARAPHTGYARHQCEYVVWGSVGSLEPADGRGPFPGSYTIPVDPREKEHLAGKPVELMRKLSRMIPPDGVILDPFAGSSSTGVGALLEGRRYLGIEREVAYIEVSRPRLERAAAYRAAQTPRSARPTLPTPNGDQAAGVVWRWRPK
jgi:site-specific DNA-methyltransferase (adenine-specific)